MRSLFTRSKPVHRIVFGTATLLGIASVFTLAASQQSSRAVASPSDVGASYLTSGEPTSSQSGSADGDFQEAMPASSTWEDALDGMGGATTAVFCCVGSAGSCGIVAGTGCPSGSTPTACPCQPAM